MKKKKATPIVTDIEIDMSLDIHVKILTPIRATRITTIKKETKEVFNMAGVQVNITFETLFGPEFEEFKFVEVELKCPVDNPSEDVREIAKLRSDALKNKIVVFICKMVNVVGMDGMVAGCSSFPNEGPTAVITARKTHKYLFAHEIGHLLKLSHVSETERLMSDQAPEKYTIFPPVLDVSEIEIIRKSNLLDNLP